MSKVHSEEKKPAFLNKRARKNRYLHVDKNKARYISLTLYQNQFQRIKDLNIILKALKLLQNH